MATRPTLQWRERLDEDLAAIAAGSLKLENASAPYFWPDTLISGTDAALDDFMYGLRYVDVESDDAVMDAVRSVVLLLNRVHRAHAGRGDSTGYEMGEREALCSYIESCLEEAGVDVDTLAARRRLSRDDITDEWRVW
jgi:hypothetical protein